MSYFTTDTYTLKREILTFSNKISRNLSKPERKFSADMTYGMLASGSCLLTDIVDQLHETSKKVNSVERLTRHLYKGTHAKALNAYLSIIPKDAIIDLRNLVRDYYYFKDLQSAIILKLNAELKVSFPAYLNVFSKITTQTSLKLLEAYPLAADMLAAPKDDTVFGRALPSNVLRIRMYIKIYREYQEHRTMTVSFSSSPCTESAF